MTFPDSNMQPYPAEASWPTCDGCGRPRQTRCPVCGEAGSSFEQAEYVQDAVPLRDPSSSQPTTGEAANVLRICPACDQVFQPEYYRCCEHCGNDHGRGIEIPLPERRDWSPREVIVALTLLTIVLGIFVYYWFLFRS